MGKKVILKDIVRPDARVYGPYFRKDGRKHVVLWWSKTNMRTVSYPKWLMEQKLGRELDPDLETIDHIDRDHTNNTDGNLQILPRSVHAGLDAKRAVPAKMKCLWCSKSLLINRSMFNHNRRQHRAGPFCSKSCSGGYGASVRFGGAKIFSSCVKLKHTMIDK